MNLQPPDRERLRQRMDACRLGSDDLSLPEMSELASALRTDAALRGEWESRQRSERLIAAAMDDLPVPAGLAERILAAAAASDGNRLAGATNQAVAAAADPNVNVEVQPPQRPRRFTRRHLSLIGGVALLLVAAVAIRQIWFAPPTRVAKEQLAVSAAGWFDAALKQRPNDPAVAKAPVRFPLGVVKLPPRAWRTMATAEESSLVAFDLTNVQLEGAVFLFAARTNKEYDVAGLPYTRLSATGGLQIGAWQQDGVLYVLVVDHRSGLRLENVLHAARLAWVEPGRRSPR